MGQQVTRRMNDLLETAQEHGLPPPICEIALHMGWSVESAARMIQKYAAMNPDTADSILVKLEAAKAE